MKKRENTAKTARKNGLKRLAKTPIAKRRKVLRDALDTLPFAKKTRRRKLLKGLNRKHGRTMRVLGGQTPKRVGMTFTVKRNKHADAVQNGRYYLYDKLREEYSGVHYDRRAEAQESADESNRIVARQGNSAASHWVVHTADQRRAARAENLRKLADATAKDVRAADLNSGRLVKNDGTFLRLNLPEAIRAGAEWTTFYDPRGSRTVANRHGEGALLECSLPGRHSPRTMAALVEQMVTAHRAGRLSYANELRETRKRLQVLMATGLNWSPEDIAD